MQASNPSRLRPACPGERKAVIRDLTAAAGSRLVPATTWQHWLRNQGRSPDASEMLPAFVQWQ